MNSEASLRASYSFYMSHLQFSTYDRLDKLRFRLSDAKLNNILVNRRIVLFNLFDYENELSGILLPKDLYRFIESPEKWNIPYPTLFQKVSYTLHLFFTNAEIYADGLMEILETREFKYSIFCVIPAIFGFFSSCEQCKFACSFYLNFINKKISLNVLKEILRPFFSGSSCFRFYEFAFSSIFSKLLASPNRKIIDLMKNNFIRALTRDLVSGIKKAAQLIPEHHLKLLKMIHLNYSMKEMIDFFIYQIKCECLIWLDSYTQSEQSKKDLIRAFDSILKNDSITRSICDSLFFASENCVFEMPEIYAPLKLNYYQTYFTMQDILVLSEVLSLKVPIIPIEGVQLKSGQPLHHIFPVKVSMKFDDSYISFPKVIFNHSIINIDYKNDEIKNESLEINDKTEIINHENILNSENQNMISMSENLNPGILNNSNNSFDILLCDKIFISADDEKQYCRVYMQILKKANDEAVDILSYYDRNPNLHEKLPVEFILKKSINIFIRQSEKFEDLLAAEAKARELNVWHKICISHEQIVFAGLSIRQAKACFESPNLVDAIQGSTEFTINASNKQLQFLTLLEKYLPSYFIDCPDISTIMNNEWKLFISKRMTSVPNIGVLFKFKPSYKFFLYVVSNISDTTDLSFPSMYLTLMNVVRNLKSIADLEETKDIKLETAIAISRCPNLLWNFFILNVFVFGNTVFRSLCSEKDQMLFQLFNKSMISIISKSEELSLFFVKYRTKIIEKILSRENTDGIVFESVV
ncbi:hypothetical protein TRFO_41167 [Tritrichomonas foetus]|uniref:Uncharacterized protein n=1 Tax=Tritrichomonas foetus TaxID=1144522 RepID=A0A1J4L5P5_9EUKA|nr:hypothetical protein TRFO_41167 [Tritrichomonas foetus]|eukprot:OHT17269.1 hypothetical protein TRFO_41167 [Tritrichomonas foetus]